jgi:hypothetical protein
MIMALLIMLSAMIFILEVSMTRAASIDLNRVMFEDYQGNVIASDYFAAGASLENIELPTPPQREGYVFISWSAELPVTMPDADLVFTPIYMQQVLSFNINF